MKNLKVKCSNFEIANDKPLLINYRGSYFFPIFQFYSESQFGGDLKTEAIYSDIEVQCLIISGGDTNCWDEPIEIVNNLNWRHQTIGNIIKWKQFESGG